MIKVTNLSKKFMMGTQEVVALDGVDIEIDDGEIAAIVGASGSGKSTLLNILGCLDVPSSGTYHLSDTEINSLSVIHLFIFVSGDAFHLMPFYK